MKRFAVICETELILFMRNFFSVFFSLVFPVLVLLIFGGIYGNDPIYPGSEIRYMDLTVPAYSVMIMGVTGLMSFPLTLAGYKEKKIYKRFDVTPVGKKAIIAAQVTVNAVMTSVGFAVLFIAGRLVYDIEIRGGFFAVLLAMVISAAAMFSVGFLFTAIGRDEKITNLLCYLSYFLMLFLSGATMPDQLFPDTIKNISAFLPMTYAVDLVQGVFCGEPLGEHIKELLVLGIITVVFIALGAIVYGRKKWE